jgi:peptidoglycan pentaglycine glycine transferase (the first glycine)
MKRNGAGILVAPEGPVLPWDNQSRTAEALGLLIDGVQSRSQDLGVMTMRIEPRLVPPVMPVLREFGRAPVDLIPKDTLYVDLQANEEALLAGMKPKGRYNIKLAERAGVGVVEGTTPDSVKRFYAVMSEAGSRDQFAVEPRQFFEHLADVLVPAGHAKLFFAEHEGDTLGTLLLITYGKRATYLYGGITNRKRNLMGGYALQLAAMNAAREAGCTTYDFYGFDPFRAPEHRYARFSQFKSQFGGNVMRFIGAQDYFFLDNVADAFVKVVNETEQSKLVHSI